MLSLRRWATVTGTVLHADGSPWVGSEVAASDDPTVFLGPTDDEPTTHTDGEGRFVLEHVPPGQVVVVARPAGGVPPPDAGQGAETVEERLRNAGAVVTSVVVEDGGTVHVVLRAGPRTPVHPRLP